jgi:hypothetical protein
MILLIAGQRTAGALRRLLRSGRRTGTGGTELIGGTEISILAPAGLSVPGWAHDPEHPAGDRIVLEGQPARAGRLTGVVTALDAVLPGDLPHVVAADRGFVAAEMTGFLRDWLATLPCPVIDRPTTLLLSGRAADRAGWSAAAATLGIPERLGAYVPVTRVTTVTIAAGCIVGPAPRPDAANPASRVRPAGPADATSRAALALARTAGVTAARLLFTAESGDPVLVGALPWWHVPNPLVLRALLAYAAERAAQEARPLSALVPM